jgi:tRNA(Phe) wybutosine-synthesizing methylase Tyw3
VRIDFASSADGPLLFSVDSCSGRINVAQLEAAIPGFPAQTEFEWYGSANSGLQSVIEPARIEIERIIKQQGMSFHIHTDN